MKKQKIGGWKRQQAVISAVENPKKQLKKEIFWSLTEIRYMCYNVFNSGKHLSVFISRTCKQDSLELCPSLRLHTQITIKERLIIQLAIGLSLFAITLAGGVTEAVVSNVKINPEPVVEEISVPAEEVLDVVPKKIQTTKEEVEEYFSDIPVMIEVSFCESQWRQFDKSGQVLRGNKNPLDVGVMQINEKYHAAKAVELGYNLYSTEGNMAYARYLYDTQGTRPWVHSKPCWNSVREVALAN